MGAVPQKRYTLEEYFELDNSSEERFEYFDGEVFEMSGVSPNHAELEGNAITLLKPILAPRGCKIYTADLRIFVPELPPFRYADLTALCGTPVFEEVNGVQCLTNPSLIVEILSSSTEAFDRGEKFRGYKSIPSFNVYLLISQDKRLVTKYVKQSEKFWLQSEYMDGEVLEIELLDCELSIDALYQGINFE